MSGASANLESLGFRYAPSGSHAARTMMLSDLTLLLEALPPAAARPDYRAAVVDANVLGKPTGRARALAYKHLALLYGLEPGIALFRNLRRLWAFDRKGRPLLALLISLARDPLLRQSQALIAAKMSGEPVTRAEVEALLQSEHRFSLASIRSFARNINGTWTQAGFLEGKVHKRRAFPRITTGAVAYALFLGHLHGLQGQGLFESHWVALLGLAREELMDLAAQAARTGYLQFLQAGGVIEVRFPGWLTPEEQRCLHE